MKDQHGQTFAAITLMIDRIEILIMHANEKESR